MEAVIVFITAPSHEEAQAIGRDLVETKLAACVNILSGVQSIFFWQEKLCCENEVLMILKTKRSLFESLCAAVKKKHSYVVPEIIAVPVIEGASSYLQWIEESTR